VAVVHLAVAAAVAVAADGRLLTIPKLVTNSHRILLNLHKIRKNW
jgi:hypothetical protein